MNLHTPDDLGRKVWTLYRNQPTLVKVVGLAVEVHVEDDDTRFVTDASNLHPSFTGLVESIKEPCPF